MIEKLIVVFKSWPVGVSMGFFMAFLALVLTDFRLIAVMLFSVIVLNYLSKSNKLVLFFILFGFWISYYYGMV